ncbi:MAG: hypothetical protein ACSLEL_01250 [Candidatus Malihini olakiniferum]
MVNCKTNFTQQPPICATKELSFHNVGNNMIYSAFLF